MIILAFSSNGYSGCEYVEWRDNWGYTSDGYEEIMR